MRNKHYSLYYHGNELQAVHTCNTYMLLPSNWWIWGNFGPCSTNVHYVQKNVHSIVNVYFGDPMFIVAIWCSKCPNEHYVSRLPEHWLLPLIPTPHLVGQRIFVLCSSILLLGSMSHKTACKQSRETVHGTNILGWEEEILIRIYSKLAVQSSRGHKIQSSFQTAWSNPCFVDKTCISVHTKVRCRLKE